MVASAKLQHTFRLSSKITVYIPSTTDINKQIDNTMYVYQCASLLSNYFGGATSTQASGYWVSPSAGLVKENTTMVFAYASENDIQTKIDEVVDYCEGLKAELSQDAIALEINGEMYFV
jgi:hypothetical protein